MWKKREVDNIKDVYEERERDQEERESQSKEIEQPWKGASTMEIIIGWKQGNGNN